MTAQSPETPASTPEPPLTFQAPPPAAPGMPNPIPPGIPWGQPITAATTEAAP
ncbi:MULTISPECIES: hypothetical protein [unclassified Arthrobacter]|uniref:hypothetical protein n=1 Tax=unclassified Arthrobacter TaxID=235627 RepID=UPI001C849F48|nr:hypothetical protein [Arthrobacter sp. MAHUQ-56]MBX7445455.1 hypothetical protein [Arthrobacter sp. MAHUQ-56]